MIGVLFMKSFIDLFRSSARELKSVRCLTITGIFVAIYMALEIFSIPIPYAKVNFAFLAIAVISMLFGPVVGLLGGGLCDIIGFIAKPDSGFLILYTLIAMFQGLIYGIMLYKKSGKSFAFWVVLSRIIDVLIINLCINTAANMYYGFIPREALSQAIAVRFIKNAVELAADIPLMLIILPAALITYNRITKIRSCR